MSAPADLAYDESGRVRFHDSCVADANQPRFEADWQRRAFGLAIALSEFGHYRWDEFQGELIRAIGEWESSAGAAGSWDYYDQWVQALQRIVDGNGLLEDGYVGPRDRDDDHDEH